LDIDWTHIGIKIEGMRLGHLRYPDDIVIFSESTRQMQIMLGELYEESRNQFAKERALKRSDRQLEKQLFWSDLFFFSVPISLFLYLILYS